MELSLTSLQFLRPWWLLALLLLPLLWWLQRHRRAQQSVWQRAVDPHLLPHLLQTAEVRGAGGASRVWLAAALLTVLALAGPSWRELPMPLWQQQSPLVIALDLSSAMRATDLPPSRMIQARAKLARLLEQRKTGQIGLMAYAGDAFTVAPITADARTVKALLDSLDPSLMPVDGQRADRAIKRAVRLMRDSGAERGEILLVTDQVDSYAQAAAEQARAEGYRLSVLGVGTLAGAPMSNAQGFITGADGQPRLAKLNPASLQALADRGGGRFATLTADDADLRGLGVLRAGVDQAGAAGGASEQQALARSDDGYWLLLGLLPLALIGFRRGWLAMLPLLLVFGLAAPESEVYAADEAPAPAAASEVATPGRLQSFWDSLWQRSDQRAYAALERGDAARARELAQDPALQGAAAYRGDDYKAAAESWTGLDQADAHYNRGNALAKSGDLPGALKAYDEALARQPGMEDALANRKIVEDALKQQQSQQSSQNQDGKDQQDQNQQGQDQQGQDQQGQDQQGQDQQGQDQQGQDQQGQDQQGQDQQGQDQQGQDQQGQDQQGQDQQGQDQQGQDRQDGKDESGAEQPSAAEQAQQQAAEEAAKREMQQALEAQQASEDGEQTEARALTPEERAAAEQQQATQQWLRRVPDDPGGLLRRKFELEYRRRAAEGDH
ncbi:MAG: VWA domain-containing protein [Rhodanobacteraceae bacterium]|nr:VWA domain-containing protein [Rhodanobacteraceae bacterium]